MAPELNREKPLNNIFAKASDPGFKIITQKCSFETPYPYSLVLYRLTQWKILSETIMPRASNFGMSLYLVASTKTVQIIALGSKWPLPGVHEFYIDFI